MKKSYFVRSLIPGVFSKLGMIGIAVFAAIFTYKGVYILSLFVVLPLITATAFRGVEFDLEKKQYRTYLWVSGFKSGDVLPLPEIDYLVIKDTVFLSRGMYQGTVDDDLYEVALICKGHLKIPLFYSYDTKKPVEFALKQKAVFQCKVEDLTKEGIGKRFI